LTITRDSFNTLLMNGSEQFLFPEETVLQSYQTTIFFDELQDNEEIIVKIEMNDPNIAARKRNRTIRVVGPQDDPALVLNWTATDKYRVSCTQSTEGTFRTIGWELLKA